VEGGGGGDFEYIMKAYQRKKQSEFWWLTREETLKYEYIYVCSQQEPYSDEPKSKKTPYLVPRLFSVDKKGNLSSEIKYYPLNFMEIWREKVSNINVFRGFSLSSSEYGGEKICGPLIIDIDREDGGFTEGYEQNLTQALKDTRRLINEYLYQFKEKDFRIFFTGHKGFDIEILPSALCLVGFERTKEQYEYIIGNINDIFNHKGEKRFIDKIHDEVRLHNSINRWIDKSGKMINRMKFELSIKELKNSSIDEICRKSEVLAFNYLKEREV